MAKGREVGGAHIIAAVHEADQGRKPIIDKLGGLVGTALAYDGCVPDKTPCGVCAACCRRAARRVVGEALEDEAHEPWTLAETARVLSALGLKLEREEAA
jgi:hypothetical protein